MNKPGLHLKWLILAVLMLLLTPNFSQAHRINVFAYIDNHELVVESYFSQGKKVREGLVEIIDEDSGQIIMRGRTDEQGKSRFPVPDEFRNGKTLRVLVNAGQGHQNEWLLKAEKTTPISNSVQSAALTREAAHADHVENMPLIKTNASEIEEIVNRALENKLAPIRSMLREELEAGPNLIQIVGGIGWIIGLAGLLAYCRSRNRHV